MEDQRCSLPPPHEAAGPVPEEQENFFSLVQRVQSRRMDEQRASMQLGHVTLELNSDPQYFKNTQAPSEYLVFGWNTSRLELELELLKLKLDSVSHVSCIVYISIAVL
uniref:Uncharacterized protein n=1 Tax=Fundulus heteroclitus TaxID=8078 RepID=A0A3Q2U6K1_FUNHE